MYQPRRMCSRVPVSQATANAATATPPSHNREPHHAASWTGTGIVLSPSDTGHLAGTTFNARLAGANVGVRAAVAEPVEEHADAHTERDEHRPRELARDEDVDDDQRVH